jgi:hypothetical protein
MVLALFVLSGCAASIGDRKLNLHRARLLMVPRRSLTGSTSTKDSRAGFRKSVSDDVTARKVSNPQSFVRATDVAMTFAYTDDRNVEIAAAQISTSTNEITPGPSGRIGKVLGVQ